VFVTFSFSFTAKPSFSKADSEYEDKKNKSNATNCRHVATSDCLCRSDSAVAPTPNKLSAKEQVRQTHCAKMSALTCNQAVATPRSFAFGVLQVVVLPQLEEKRSLCFRSQ